MSSNGDSAGSTVLIADDDEDIRELIRFRLEQASFSVLVAADGEEAFELALDHHPNVAVLDVMMPKLDGFELTRRIRAHDELAHTPIILLTASVQDSSVTKGLEAGADDYMRKPFAPQELLDRVRAVMARR